MSFDCHGQPITLPADLDGVFTQPESIYDFHFVLQQLDPALKEIFTLVSHSQYGRYLRGYAAHFVLQDFVTFISRKAPSGKCYWEGYNDGPRKFSFIYWICCAFMAYLRRPETKAQLLRRRQAIDARDAALLRAGRKKYAEVQRDPHGYFTPPTPPATPREAAMTQAAKETCRKMIEETQQRADIILEEAQRQAQEILARAREGRRPPIDMGPIRFMSDDDEDN